jgi:hypothetical protein
MAEERDMTPEQAATVEQADQPEQAVTPALVRVVAEKVYTLWLNDLRLERERLGVHGVSHKRW